MRMIDMNPFLTLALLVAAIVFGYILFTKGGYPNARSRLPLPPGPRRLILIGNLLDIPNGFEWESYEKWGRQFNSPIIYLNVAGAPIVILNSAKAVKDLLEDRSLIYSCRPVMVMVRDLMGWHFNLGGMPYGEEWREHRKMFHQEFNSNAYLRFQDHLKKATNNLLRRLLTAPEDFLPHIRHMTGELIMSVTYGIDVQPSNDPYIDLAERALHSLVAAVVPGAFLVDSIPLLRFVPAWFPGAGFQRKAIQWKKDTTAMRDIPYEFAKRESDAGTGIFSVASSLIERLGSCQDASHQEYVIKNVLGTAYAAGAETTAAALGTFFLAMLHNPDVQTRARQELDAVVGKERLPTLEDESSLPYITAVVKEGLRWRPVAPAGLAHRLMEEDTYKGYRIPNGSIVIANSWAILHDEEDYPNPSLFNPDRFIKDEKLNPDIKDPMTAAFGYGRRICPGRFFGYSSLWLTVACVLATFEISQGISEDGSLVEPTDEYVSGMVTCPAPFKCTIAPRSTQAEALVRSIED